MHLTASLRWLAEVVVAVLGPAVPLEFWSAPLDYLTIDRKHRSTREEQMRQALLHLAFSHSPDCLRTRVSCGVLGSGARGVCDHR